MLMRCSWVAGPCRGPVAYGVISVATSRHSTTAMPTSGTRISAIDDDGQGHRRPVASVPGQVEDQLLELDPGAARAHELGQRPEEPAEGAGQQRHDHEDPGGDEAPRSRAQLGHPRVCRVAGPQAAQHRPDPGEQVRHPGQVGEDEVAVEADHGDELLEHLDLQGERGEQEEPAAGREVPGAERQDRQDVEVEPAEVGADAAGAAEAVGVGDVGVERGEDEVDADPDLARLGAAVVAGRGVARARG